MCSYRCGQRGPHGELGDQPRRGSIRCRGSVTTTFCRGYDADLASQAKYPQRRPRQGGVCIVLGMSQAALTGSEVLRTLRAAAQASRSAMS